MQQNFIDIFSYMNAIPESTVFEDDDLFFLYSTMPAQWANMIFVKNKLGIDVDILQKQIIEMEKKCSDYVIYFSSDSENIPASFLQEKGFLGSMDPHLEIQLRGDLKYQSQVSGLTFKRVEDEETYDQWLKVFAEGFDLPEELITIFKKWQMFDGFGSSAKFKNFVATIDNEVVGTSSISLTGNYCGFYNVVVTEKWRRQSISSDLVSYILNYAHEQGAKKAGCYSTPIAIGHYKKLGMIEGINLLSFTKK